MKYHPHQQTGSLHHIVMLCHFGIITTVVNFLSMSYGQGPFYKRIGCSCSIVSRLCLIFTVTIFGDDYQPGFWTLICLLKDAENICFSSLHYYQTCSHNYYLLTSFSSVNLFICFYFSTPYKKQPCHKLFSIRYPNRHKYFLLFCGCYNNLQSCSLKGSVSFIVIGKERGVFSFWNCCWRFVISLKCCWYFC